MCGRFVLEQPVDQLLKQIEIFGKGAFSGSTNIAPSEKVPAVVKKDDAKYLDEVVWGYSTNWSSGPKFLINLKSETIREKKFAAGPLKAGRCILPANGFYEWQNKEGECKVPVLFSDPDQSIIGLAGILFKSSKGGFEAVILTTNANKVVGEFHNRMPIILAQSAWAEWLMEENQDKLFADLVKPYADEHLRARKVIPEFNNARYKGPLEFQD